MSARPLCLCVAEGHPYRMTVGVYVYEPDRPLRFEPRGDVQCSICDGSGVSPRARAEERR